MRFVLSVMLVCGSLVGCAGSRTTTRPNEPGEPSVSSPAQPSPSDTPAPSGAAKAPSGTGRSDDPTGKPAAPRTLTGTVRAGVEPNCLLLDGYLLVGGPRDQLSSGTRVTVTGRVQADLMTTCQQGTPFLVESAKPA
jgi:hypothetical protein